jgi:ribosome-binding factor A
VPNSTRAAQLADQIRDNVATWIQRDFPGSFVSVTDTTLSMDLRIATVWLHPAREEDVATFHKILKKTGHYSNLLQRAITRRFVPALQFSLDQKAEAAEHLDQLLNR